MLAVKAMVSIRVYGKRIVDIFIRFRKKIIFVKPKNAGQIFA